MNTSDIKKLIEAYYNGDTSPEEDNILFNYFSGNDIAEDLQSEKEYFLQVCKLEKADIPVGFHTKIDTLFDKLEGEETRQSKRKRLSLWVGGVAASVAIILFFVLNNHDMNNQTVLSYIDTLPANNIVIEKPDTIPMISKVDTSADVKEVKTVPVEKKIKVKAEKTPAMKADDYEKVKKALESVALNMNEGLEQLNSVSENLAQTTEIINSNKYK